MLPWLEFSSHPFTVLSRGTEGDQVYLDLVIAPVQGFSRKLARATSQKTQQCGSYETVALVEGPYGFPAHLGYRTVALFASGVGIAHTEAILLQSLSAGRWQQGQNLWFVWVIKDQTSLLVLLSYLSSALGSYQRRGTEGALEVRVFCTRVPRPELLSTPGGELATAPVTARGPSELTLHEEAALLDADNVAFLGRIRAAGATVRLHVGGRPDVDEEMELACSMASGLESDAEPHSAPVVAAPMMRYGTFDDPLAHSAEVKTAPILVSSCGGPEFSDQVRLAVRRVRSLRPDVDLHEEVFAW